MCQSAWLFVNLGSPDAPETRPVRRYLAEFLMDGRVIDVPFLLRSLIVYGFVLPFRPARSAHAYRSIWRDGSPLVQISRSVAERAGRLLNDPVYLAMRYGRPSIKSVISGMHKDGVRNVRLWPMYPHYAMSSFETVVEKVREECSRHGLSLEVIPPIYRDPGYIGALSGLLRNSLAEHQTDHVLFSYHGIPERHLKKVAGGSYCLSHPACCDTPDPVHGFCYRHQVFETAREVVKRIGMGMPPWSVSFQSRLGRARWLLPDTESVLRELAEAGKQRVTVIAPSFVADCLETLEELQIRGREVFLEAGGREFHYVPALNDNDDWITALADLLNRRSQLTTTT